MGDVDELGEEEVGELSVVERSEFDDGNNGGSGGKCPLAVEAVDDESKEEVVEVDEVGEVDKVGEVDEVGELVG